MNTKLSSVVGLLAIVALLLTTGGWAWQTAAPAGEPPAQEAADPQYVEDLQAALDSWREDNDLVGVTLAVYAPDLGSVELASGLADLEAGTPMAPDHRLLIASMTKTFIATLVLQLVDEGVLSLDDRLGDWFPDFPNADKITVRQMLSHTSGATDYMIPENRVKFADIALERASTDWPGWTPDELIDEAAQIEPLFEPGSSFAYSNSGTVLLGRIVELVTGSPLEVELRRRFFEPLELEDTFLAGHEEIPGGWGPGYSTVHAALFGVTEPPAVVDERFATLIATNSWASGGLVSTAGDVVRFERALSGGELLSEAALAEMMTPSPVVQSFVAGLGAEDIGGGLGVFLYPFPAPIGPGIGHDGGEPGFTSVMLHFPDHEISIAVLLNDDRTHFSIYPRGEDIDTLMTDVVLVTLEHITGDDLSDLKSSHAGEDIAGQLQAALDAAVSSPEANFPGAVLYVDSPEFGPWAGAAGLGDTETGTPAGPNDKFRAGSVMKPFIGVVVLQLVEEGLISLDDPLPAVVPEAIAAKVAGSEEITVRMLLNHTSGIADWVGPALPEIVADPAKIWTVDEAVDIAAAIGPSFGPGEDYTYSNTEYNLLELVIEQATGRSWREEIRERIVEPLNMKDTVLPEPGDLAIPGEHMHGYATMEGEVLDVTAWDPSMAGGAGGSALVTTSADLARFLDALRAGELFQSSESMGEMLAFVDVSTDPAEAYHTGYGLGVMRFELPGGVEMLGHFGGTAGYVSFVYYLPAQDITISGAMNSMESRQGQLIYPALEILVPGFEAAREQRPQEANVYEDPEGRFSIPLIGDWTQIETDGTYAQFAYAEPPLDMYVAAVESGDLEAGVDAALRQVGVDPAALTLTNAGNTLGLWFVFFYSVGDGQGVAVLAQVRDETTYAIVATGREEVVVKAEPPGDVLDTIEGFTFAGQEGTLPTTVEEFETYINSFVGDIPPGLSIAIALGGDVIYAKGFGLADGPKGMAATPDTVYQWGSMAKMVTATAVLQLRDKGLLDLDAPISDYLDYFPAEYPITVRQLLNHSAGFPEGDAALELFNVDGEPLPDPDLGAREYIEHFTGPIFEPGTASAYANPHLLLLGQIVAEASGQPYIEYAQDNILTPLGMENTDFTYSSETMIANAAAHAIPAGLADELIAAVGEVWKLGDTAGLIRESDDQYAWLNRLNLLAAWGGLKGSPTDAIRFLQMHLNGGELDGVRILSPESVKMMQEVQISTSGDPLEFTLGWRIGEDAEHPYVEHAGGGQGIKDLMRLYPREGIAIILMSNAAGYDEVAVVEAAANVVFSMMAQ